MKKMIVLVGGGGHCKVIIDALNKSRNYSIFGIVDPALEKGQKKSGIPVLGGDSELEKIFKKKIRHACISVGSIGNSKIREKIYTKLKKIGFELPVVIHPDSVIASDVKIEEGVFIAAAAVINPASKIGRNAIINTSASVDHDCTIGDFVHIAPGATLSGEVKVGNGTHIGTGANVIQCINIGKYAFIRAGTVVARNVLDNEKYSG